MNRYKGSTDKWDGRQCPLEYSKQVVALHKHRRETLNTRLLREQKENKHHETP